MKHMGGCQNYGPLFGTLNIRCRMIIRTQKGTLILTTTLMTLLRDVAFDGLSPSGAAALL